MPAVADNPAYDALVKLVSVSGPATARIKANTTAAAAATRATALVVPKAMAEVCNVRIPLLTPKFSA